MFLVLYRNIEMKLNAKGVIMCFSILGMYLNIKCKNTSPTQNTYYSLNASSTQQKC